jgi:hypothetical protein
LAVALVALRRMPRAERRVIERAYGAASASPYAHVWAVSGEEIARLAPLCPSVERARVQLVDAAAPGGGGARETADRATFAADALRLKLDAAPADALARLRWKAERVAFIERVRKEAEALLRDAVKAYREARG